MDELLLFFVSSLSTVFCACVCVCVRACACVSEGTAGAETLAHLELLAFRDPDGAPRALSEARHAQQRDLLLLRGQRLLVVALDVLLADRLAQLQLEDAVLLVGLAVHDLDRDLGRGLVVLEDDLSVLEDEVEALLGRALDHVEGQEDFAAGTGEARDRQQEEAGRLRHVDLVLGEREDAAMVVVQDHDRRHGRHSQLQLRALALLGALAADVRVHVARPVDLAVEVLVLLEDVVIDHAQHHRLVRFSSVEHDRSLEAHVVRALVRRPVLRPEVQLHGVRQAAFARDRHRELAHVLHDRVVTRIEAEQHLVALDGVGRCRRRRLLLLLVHFACLPASSRSARQLLRRLLNECETTRGSQCERASVRASVSASASR